MTANIRQQDMDTESKKLVHKSYWGDRLVEIFDRGDYRYLYFNSRFLQSKMSLSSPRLLTLPYTRYMMLSLLFTPQPKKILLIGLGAGSLVRYLHHILPECHIDAVDHSPQIIDLARGYFRLPESEYVHIHCDDGVRFLSEYTTDTTNYDLILLDAFDEQGMADTIYSRNFFHLCKKKISKQGQLCCNLWSGKEDDLIRIAEDLAEFFPGQLTCPVPQRGNIINYSLPFRTGWRTFAGLSRHKQTMSDRFGLDFETMTKKLIRNNLTKIERLLLTILG